MHLQANQMKRNGNFTGMSEYEPLEILPEGRKLKIATKIIQIFSSKIFAFLSKPYKIYSTKNGNIIDNSDCCGKISYI
jgi:hypothetical protein